MGEMLTDDVIMLLFGLLCDFEMVWLSTAFLVKAENSLPFNSQCKSIACLVLYFLLPSYLYDDRHCIYFW